MPDFEALQAILSKYGVTIWMVNALRRLIF
jgi:hypothetical protein